MLYKDSKFFFAGLCEIFNIDMAINPKNLIVLLSFGNNLLMSTYLCQGKTLSKWGRYTIMVQKCYTNAF